MLDLSNPANWTISLLAVLPSSSSPGSEQIASSLSSKVDMTRCLFREDCTEAATSYILKSRSKDTRTIVNYNHLPEMTAEEFIAIAKDLGENGSWYHFEVSCFHCFSAFPLKMSRDVYLKLLFSVWCIYVRRIRLSKSAWKSRSQVAMACRALQQRQT